MIIGFGSAFLFMFMLWADFNIYLNQFIWTSHNRRLCNMKSEGFNLMIKKHCFKQKEGFIINIFIDLNQR